ncbi:hypothetical protein BKA63DRAFT_501828 [Paraphoma chrysanthemicola]|nr:hypothetical protein BKA63DRAFT_501828 [Paraphoma chrysanthemicola]
MVLSPKDEAEIEKYAVQEDRKGLEVLRQPKESSSDLAIDIIAVHGLGGDSHNTWTDNKSGKLWLRDLLPDSEGFGNARIMTFGYDARPWLRPGSNTTARSFTFAESLLSEIRSLRLTTDTPEGKPIMFIGHSLGGIVIKKALVIAQANRTQYKDVFDSTRSVIFFGTPHQGATAVDWTEKLELVSRVVGLKRSKVLKELELWSDSLLELSQTFFEQSNTLLITSFYERQPYNGVYVVREGSARGPFLHDTPIGLDANHHTICKFASTTGKFRTVHLQLYLRLTQIRAASDAIGIPPKVDDLVQRLQSLRDGL